MDPKEQQASMLRSIDAKDAKGAVKTKSIVVAVYIILIALGIGTGYLLAAKTTGGSAVSSKGTQIQTPTVVGVQDTSTFKDCAIGTLQKGGFDGEGTHHLDREGGPSQTAYLISSIIDLDQYVGKSVKICGQTLAAKHVSWLMDVGRLEIQ